MCNYIYIYIGGCVSLYIYIYNLSLFLSRSLSIFFEVFPFFFGRGALPEQFPRLEGLAFVLPVLRDASLLLLLNRLMRAGQTAAELMCPEVNGPRGKIWAQVQGYMMSWYWDRWGAIMYCMIGWRISHSIAHIEDWPNLRFSPSLSINSPCKLCNECLTWSGFNGPY